MNYKFVKEYTPALIKTGDERLSSRYMFCKREDFS